MDEHAMKEAKEDAEAEVQAENGLPVPENASSLPEDAPEESEAIEGLPGWYKSIDPETGDTYYWDETGKSQWTYPTDVLAIGNITNAEAETPVPTPLETPVPTFEVDTTNCEIADDGPLTSFKALMTKLSTLVSTMVGPPVVWKDQNNACFADLDENLAEKRDCVDIDACKSLCGAEPDCFGISYTSTKNCIMVSVARKPELQSPCQLTSLSRTSTTWTSSLKVPADESLEAKYRELNDKAQTQHRLTRDTIDKLDVGPYEALMNDLTGCTKGKSKDKERCRRKEEEEEETPTPDGGHVEEKKRTKKKKKKMKKKRG